MDYGDEEGGDDDDDDAGDDDGDGRELCQPGGAEKILWHKSDPTNAMIIAAVKKWNKRHNHLGYDGDDVDGDNNDEHNDCRLGAAEPMRC